MGVLTDGTPLTWEEITSVCELFRSYALSQLVRIYQKFKDRQGDPFYWGDEVINLLNVRICFFFKFLFLINLS